MAATTDGERSLESRRILDRVARQADSSGPALVGRAVERTRNHLAAADADGDDWAELWGTRIGRALAAVLTIALIAWAVSLLVVGA